MYCIVVITVGYTLENRREYEYVMRRKNDYQILIWTKNRIFFSPRAVSESKVNLLLTNERLEKNIIREYIFI